MKKTLLERAQAHRSSADRVSRSRFPQIETEELAVAYMTGKISFTQVQGATGLKGSNVYNMLATTIRRGCKANRLSISRKKI